MSKRIIAAALSVMMLIGMCSCTSKTAVDSTESTSEAGLSINPEYSYSTEMPDYSFETYYGSQAYAYMNHQYYINGEPISIAESNYYFVDALIQLTNRAMYGYYPVTSEGFLDLSAAYDQEDNENGYETYGDFYVDYAERMLASTSAIVMMAEAEGMELDEETYAAIDELISNVTVNYAIPNGMTLDQYLALNYGPECDEAAIREIFYHFYLADAYTSAFVEDYDFEGETFEVPAINYTLFYAPEETLEAPLLNYTLYAYNPEAEDAEELISAAEVAANNLVLISNDDTSMLRSNGMAAYASGTAASFGEIAVTENFEIPELEAWLNEEGRQIGDIGAVFADGYGYFALGYIGVAGEFAESAAQDLLDDADNLDELIELGNQLYADGECRESGTIQVPLGRMVPAFEEWAYGEDRYEGEIDLIYAPEFGYFVVGYTGLQVDQNAKDQASVEALSSYVAEKLDNGEYNVYTEDTFTSAEPVTDVVVSESGTVPSEVAEPVQSENPNKAEDSWFAIKVTALILSGVFIIAIAGSMLFKKPEDKKVSDKETKENNDQE